MSGFPRRLTNLHLIVLKQYLFDPSPFVPVALSSAMAGLKVTAENVRTAANGATCRRAKRAITVSFRDEMADVTLSRVNPTPRYVKNFSAAVQLSFFRSGRQSCITAIMILSRTVTDAACVWLGEIKSDGQRDGGSCMTFLSIEIGVRVVV